MLHSGATQKKAILACRQRLDALELCVLSEDEIQNVLRAVICLNTATPDDHCPDGVTLFTLDDLDHDHHHGRGHVHDDDFI